jgi:hypothetical protein
MATTTTKSTQADGSAASASRSDDATPRDRFHGYQFRPTILRTNC